MLPKRPGSKHNQPQSRIEWHRLAVDEIFTRLETGPIGLPCIETQRRLLDVGPNGIEFKRPSVWARFFRQFNNPLVYIQYCSAHLLLNHRLASISRVSRLKAIKSEFFTRVNQ